MEEWFFKKIKTQVRVDIVKDIQLVKLIKKAGCLIDFGIAHYARKLNRFSLSGRFPLKRPKGMWSINTKFSLSHGFLLTGYIFLLYYFSIELLSGWKFDEI